MKLPKEPRKPTPPLEPQEFYEQEDKIYLTDPYKNYTLEEFLNNLPKGIEKDSLRVCYRDYSYDYDSIEVFTIVSLAKVRNPYYKSLMTKYKKLLKEYEKAKSKYDLDYAQYLKDQKEYDNWIAETEISRLEKRISQLKKKKS